MGQHDDNLKASREQADNTLPSHYYVCSPSAPAFIPQSPMAVPPPSHYPYLYNETYPQMSHMHSGGMPVYSGEFLKPTPMSHYVLNVDGDKVPAEAVPEKALRPEQQKTPWWYSLTTFTVWISVAQVALFIVAMVKGGVAPLQDNFNIGPPTATLVDFGAKVAFLMRYDGEGWRFISAMFIHAGVLHIVLNLIAQVRLGVTLERDWGRFKCLTIYLVSGVGATLMSCLLQPDTISVGASGAILGLVGAYFANIILVWRKLDPRTKKMQVIQACFILLVLGLMCLAPHIDSSAHFGGLAIGFVLGFALLPDETHPPVAKKLRLFFLLLIIAFFAIGFWYFYDVQTPPILNI